MEDRGRLGSGLCALSCRVLEMKGDASVMCPGQPREALMDLC